MRDNAIESGKVIRTEPGSGAHVLRGDTISIGLVEGATVTCTFTNIATAPPNTSVLDSIADLPKAVGRGGAAGIGVAMTIALGLVGGMFVVGYRFRPAKRSRRRPPMARRVRR